MSWTQQGPCVALPSSMMIYLYHLQFIKPQVAISFPGADFDKGSEGHRAGLLDHEGKVLATSGTEFAEALQHWLVEDWLEGDEQQGARKVPKVQACSFAPPKAQPGARIMKAAVLTHAFTLHAGLDHVFVCSKNLRYCPGSIKAKNFRHYAHAGAGATDAGAEDNATAILNENWAMYLRVRSPRGVGLCMWLAPMAPMP